MKNLNQIRLKNLPLDTLSLDAKNTQLTLANTSLLYRNLTSQQNTLLSLKTNDNINGWQINSLGASQNQFALTDATSGVNTGLSVRTSSAPKVGIGNSTNTCALQVSGGVAVTSSVTDAPDPGAGNLLLSGLLTAQANGNNFLGSLRFNGADANSNQIYQSTFNTRLGISANGGDITFGQTNTPQVFLLPNGNLGVGTSVPGTKFVVAGGVIIRPDGVTISDPGSGNLTIAGGLLNLANATNNLISFVNTVGGLPAFTTRSVGTKLLLRQALSGTTVDYAIGVDSSGAQWYSVPSATSTHYHAFFGATTELVRFQGNGFNGLGTSTPGCRLQVNGGLAVSNAPAAVTDPGAGNLSVAGESRLTGGLVLSTRIYTVVAGTTTVSLLANDCVIITDSTAGAITFLLPASANGKLYRIKKATADNNTVTLRPQVGGKLIDTVATYVLTTVGAAVDVISDVNGNWWVY